MINIECDPDGMVTGFPYHDGELDGLVVNGHNEVLLALRSIDGERRLLTLSGLEHLNVDEFRQGNIVTEMYVMSRELLLKHEEFTNLVATKLFLPLDKIRAESIVFVLQSDYGAEIVAVCSDVSVSGGRLVPMRGV